MPKTNKLEKLAAEIGERIRKFREEHGLLQKDLAEGTGVPSSQISQYENGREVPRVYALVRLSRYMDQSLDLLVNGHKHDGTEETDPVTREIFKNLQRASPTCRRAVLEIVTALIAQDLEK